jgi:hypothetical protein
MTTDTLKPRTPGRAAQSAARLRSRDDAAWARPALAAPLAATALLYLWDLSASGPRPRPPGDRDRDRCDRPRPGGARALCPRHRGDAALRRHPVGRPRRLVRELRARRSSGQLARVTGAKWRGHGHGTEGWCARRPRRHPRQRAAPTPARFQAYVRAGDVHYLIASGGAGGGAASAAISAWVKQHFTAATVGGVTVYDLTS